MTRLVTNVRLLGVGAVLMASAAPAQFRLDYAPSAQRAAAAPPAPVKPNLNRIAPLSPLGGPQGTPGGIVPSAPLAPTQAYAGVPVASPAPAPGAQPDPSVDDPNRPRAPLKPKTLARGVAPRP